MRRPLRTTACVIAATCAVTVAGSSASPAHAAPPGEAFEQDCGELGTFEIAPAPGRATFTPALVSGSTAVFVPTSFEDFRVTAYALADEAGEEDVVVGTDAETFREAKGRVEDRTGLTLVTCTYSDSFTAEEDPFLQEMFPEADYAVFEGEVTGFFTPARP